MDSHVEISVIVPFVERFDKMSDLYFTYKQDLEAFRKTYEFICVLDGNYPEAFEELMSLNRQGEKLKIIKLARGFGEATALTVGFEHASGDIILTLPSYQQVEAGEITRVLKALDDHDMAVARRWPRKDSIFNRMQSRVFHFFLAPLSKIKLHDMGCGVRAFKKRVIEDVKIYGEQHRFLPIFAYKYGFKVTEVDVAQSAKDAFQRIYPASTYIQRILDIFSVFFLVEFTKKPLRFFGILGSSLFVLGFLITVYLVSIRVFLGEPLADRPLLLLGVLLVVVGIQVFAIGLIGEIIIFIHAKDIKEYTIDQVIN